MIIFFLKALSFAFGHLPVWLGRAAGSILGSLARRILKRHWKTALENLERAFGESLSASERERIAARVFRNLGIMLFEFLRMPWLGKKGVEAIVEFKGLEKIEKALERGKGVLLVTAHYGNWELLHASLGHKGYSLELVVRKMDSPLIEQFVRWVRTRSGINIVYKVKAMLPLVRRLNANAVAMILVDQNTMSHEGVFVDFFGVPASTNKGPALLAQKTGAAVLPVFISRDGHKHVVEVWDEIAIVDTGDRDADTETNTATLTKAVEKAIRTRPDQWFWVHRRWKTRP
ncbi:MAG: lysophospholipid acyltransferase family protein [Deltaproteobacteria bacterium]|nr:lysophospholipid acyltransferase family protein [Deltaproteobacteria bacterium]